MKRFYWLFERKTRQWTIARETEGKWEIFDAIEGWWTRDEVLEEYDVGAELMTPRVPA